jgi:amidohydrolase
MLKNKITKLALELKQETIGLRQHLHANPELSFQEFETCDFIANFLKKQGISYKIIGKTGITGVIEGKNPNKRVIALRADIDALPIVEENQIPYKSTKPGIMHACGHDVHTSILMGAVKVLNELKSEWEGTVKFIFQPGEEKNPGGASILINEGVLENPSPQKIIGLHVHPGLATGKLSFRSGKVMASADELYFSIKAKGGHAAAPQFTPDTILITSHIVVALQQMISRNNNPFNPSVLSITSIQGGSATNIIPSEVKVMGTLRCMDETWRIQAHELIKKTIIGIADTMGATASVNIDIGYPCVMNDEAVTNEAKKLAEDLLGSENVEETELRMGAEDFGYYSHKIPGTFFRLGVMNQMKETYHGVHTPRFNADEDAIELGVATMAWLGASI